MNKTQEAASTVYDQLTAESKAFLIDLCMIAGNGAATPEELDYYRKDLYTWYDASDLLSKYTKNQIGGFLKHFHGNGIVAGCDRDSHITEIGVEVAILVTA